MGNLLSELMRFAFLLMILIIFPSSFLPPWMFVQSLVMVKARNICSPRSLSSAAMMFFVKPHKQADVPLCFDSRRLCETESGLVQMYEFSNFCGKLLREVRLKKEVFFTRLPFSSGKWRVSEAYLWSSLNSLVQFNGLNRTFILFIVIISNGAFFFQG